jgi:predicted aminopeptidase
MIPLRNFFKVLFRILEVVIIILCIYIIFNFKLVAYGIQQLKGQVAIVTGAKPIEDFISDSSFPDSLKKKLFLIKEIKQFAIDSLGLKETKNYTTLYNQHGKPLLMNLTAAEQFRLKAYTWNFPLLGTVSYKGFFDFKKGEAEADALRKNNYDVEYDPVSAWSTLGWFRDPVFSGMLKRKEGQLAELIIHEMTHATIYLKSSVDFNENLASAIGEVGSQKFLASKFGINSVQLSTYLNEQEDYNRFANQMLRGTKILDSLYTATEKDNEEIKLHLKKEMIEAIVSSLDTVSFHNIKYKNYFKDETPNNAFFMSFMRYDSQKEDMKKELNIKYKGIIQDYIKSLEK